MCKFPCPPEGERSVFHAFLTGDNGGSRRFSQRRFEPNRQEDPKEQEGWWLVSYGVSLPSFSYDRLYLYLPDIPCQTGCNYLVGLLSIQ
jgi:hypothetical protein